MRAARDTDAAPDPTFPRFGSLGDLTEPTFRWRWKLKYSIICALLFAFVVGREIGLIDVSWASFKIGTKTEATLSGSGQTRSGDEASISQRSVTNTTTWNTDGSFHGVGLWFYPTGPWTIDLRTAIQNKFGRQTGITATVEELTLSGLYWLPVSKSGSCRYRIRIQFVGTDLLRYSGELTGVTDFSYFGLIPIRILKQKLAEEIADDVVKNVKQMADTER